MAKLFSKATWKSKKIKLCSAKTFFKKKEKHSLKSFYKTYNFKTKNGHEKQKTIIKISKIVSEE